MLLRDPVPDVARSRGIAKLIPSLLGAGRPGIPDALLFVPEESGPSAKLAVSDSRGGRAEAFTDVRLRRRGRAFRRWAFLRPAEGRSPSSGKQTQPASPAASETYRSQVTLHCPEITTLPKLTRPFDSPGYSRR